MKKSTNVTLDDIARLLNVSRVTVSKALRGHPDISAEMTKKIRKVAEERGYTPNIFARSLSSRSSNMIGLVVPKIAHYFFGAVIEGVYDTAHAANYETILTVSQENPERERKHLQTLMSMRVDGIIVSISQKTSDLKIFDLLRKSGIPVLFLDRRPDPPLPGFNSIVADDRGGAFKAVEQAIKVGYKKIAFIGGNTHVNIGKNRLAGFESAMKQHNLPLEKDWILTGGFGRNVGYDGLMQFYTERKLPEFIFAITYPIALGIYDAAKELGLKIPQDIDVISFGDSDVSRIISPALSCVSQPSYELGSKAVELMLKTIAHPESSRDQHVMLPTEVILRETCTGKNTVVPSADASQASRPLQLHRGKEL